MNSLKIRFICLLFATSISAQKKAVQLKIMVANNYVDKVFLRNKSAIILEIGLKKKGVFETAFDIDEGVYQLKYDTYYTDVYLKKGFNLSCTFDGLNFYETLKFTGAGAHENNFIASEFQKNDTVDINFFYNLNESELETYLIDIEKSEVDKLSQESFNAFFVEYETKCIKAQVLKMRDLYQDRRLTQKK